jgi:hypothetical protein
MPFSIAYAVYPDRSVVGNCASRMMSDRRLFGGQKDAIRRFAIHHTAKREVCVRTGFDTSSGRARSHRRATNLFDGFCRDAIDRDFLHIKATWLASYFVQGSPLKFAHRQA